MAPTSARPPVPFSVVVVTWNSAPELGPLLESFAEHLSGSYEVVVVDNASTDGTLDVAEAWGGGELTAIRLDGNRGFGAANNVGVRAARHATIVMLNPDTLLVDRSLADLASFSSATGALCGPELIDRRGARQPSASPLPAGWELLVGALLPGALMPARLRMRCEPWRSLTTRPVGWLTGACVAAPRDVLLRLGPFDERIHLYSEDMDLGIRARAGGVACLFAPDVARVVHLGDRSSSRRFADAGLELSIRNRREVVRRRHGRVRERYDFVLQLLYHGLRYGAKRALRREYGREERWLKVAARLSARNSVASR